MNKNLKLKLRKIKLLALDFDGVMTDGFVYVDQNGLETVKCSRKDGLGITMIKRVGIQLCVLSTETNPVIQKRCDKLQIPCIRNIQSSEKKLDMLKKFMKRKKIKWEEVAYMGDDLNDSVVFRYVGISITVSDGHQLLKKKAHYITEAPGGQHALREICELILEAKGVPLHF